MRLFLLPGRLKTLSRLINATALIALFFLPLSQTALAQTDPGYSNHEQRSQRLQKLAQSPQITLSSVGKSAADRDLWLLQFGSGEPTAKPALLVVAGVDGAHPAGTELALQMAEQLATRLNESEFQDLLATKTLFFLPAASPDALEQITRNIKTVTRGNDKPQDDDRDGNRDEDMVEDLNGDGWITWMRIQDATGEYIASTEDPRLMVKADPAKGENGQYRLVQEGRDNDQDGQFNEDKRGGVNIDRNFAFDYPIFADQSGDYAASETETRAVMDLLYMHPNIYAVLTFGPANNLTNPPSYNASAANQRVVKGVLEQDAAVHKTVSDLYKELISTSKEAPKLAQSGGNFSQTAYFHGGRFSLITPGWWATPDSSWAKEADMDEEKLAQWASENDVEIFAEWQSVNHPDFPDQQVEVGGIQPFAAFNPPVSFLATSATEHLAFITKVAENMPAVSHQNVRQESLGNGVHRITVALLNEGQLPTNTELGNRIRWNQKLITEISLSGGQQLLSGRKVQLQDALGAGASVEYSWLVSGRGEVSVETKSATIATQTSQFNLR